MTADERRRKAINEYYSKYREYQKLDNVREHMRVEISGDTLIEIHRYYGDRKGERVLRVTQEEVEGAEVTAEVAAYSKQEIESGGQKGNGKKQYAGKGLGLM